MKKQHVNSTLIIFISLVLLTICISVGCLFLYFSGNESSLKNATIVFSYSDDSSKLLMDNSMPVTDAIGKQLSFTPNFSYHLFFVYLYIFVQIQVF